MNVCTTCNKDFGSVEAFDAHRVGAYLQKGSSEYTGDAGDWTHSQGRRCLTTEEMEEKFILNSRGTWSLKKSLERARLLHES